MATNKHKAGGSKAERKARLLVYVSLAVIGLGAAVQLWIAIFPNRAPVAPIHDTAALHDIFFSGKPSFLVCNNGTLDSRSRTTFDDAAAELGKEVYSAFIDCNAPLPSGQNIAQRFDLDSSWKPVWFVAVNGRRPRQISASYIRKPAELAAQVRSLVGNKVMKIGNSQDLDSCVRERSGGCIIVYSTRDVAQVASDLEAVMNSSRTVRFSLVNGRALALHASPGSLFSKTFTEAVKLAKAAAVAEYGMKADVILAGKKVPSDSAVENESLFVVTTSSRPGTFTGIDVADVLRLQQEAFKALATLVSDQEDASTNIDSLLRRDDVLEQHGAALVGRGELQIVRPARSRGTRATFSRSADAEQPRDDPTRDRRRKQTRGSQGDSEREEKAFLDEGEQAGSSGPSDDHVIARERARRRREQMLREEADSGYIAHLASEELSESLPEDAVIIEDGPALPDDLIDLDS